MTDTIYLTLTSGFIQSEINDKYGLLSSPEINIVNPGPYFKDEQAMDINFAMEFSRHAAEVLGNYLKKQNTYELFVNPDQPLDKQDFFPTSGATQLQTALTYALATTDPLKKYLIVEKKPFFNLHQSPVINFPYTNVEFQGFNDPSDIIIRPEQILVEYVTSPNNPDGSFREPLTDAIIIFADFVFASDSYGPNGDGYLDRNLKWIRKARADGKLIFSYDSASKHFGRAGDRWGYMWYPKYDPLATQLLTRFTLGAFLSGGDSSTSGAALLNYVDHLTSLPRQRRASFLEDIHLSLNARYTIVLNQLLARYPGSLEASVTGGPALFIKIKDPRIPLISAVEVIFIDVNTRTNTGTIYGESKEYARVSLMATSFDLAQFCNRLSNSTNFTPRDFLISNENTCSHKTINCEFLERNKQYILNPNDCIIDADTDCYPIEILLPKFFSYEFSKIFTIRKINDCGYDLTIRSADFTIKLARREKMRVQWENPFLVDGHWIII
ncbi:MAG: aminotransferase class I/II-fold pyridoxal phosphate-dependent enzyme [Harvfovirus sp.]|uniref:Aminotransferase class I/II-fold pyridoxal phosphate-dependent enzyme n=1 Tax=Harvfovirus sp. TaxID=2487768 RepID=A0A3G5A522_9VIRU|nr:MAG: aminotransferase class I/II-fold pyridoxal phosphate-dependent enzyme [Harvfovirus sp.]